MSTTKLLAASKSLEPKENAVLTIKYFIQCQIQELNSNKDKKGLQRTKIVNVSIDKTNERKSLYKKGKYEIKVYSPVAYTKLSENGDYLPITKSISYEVYDDKKTVLTLSSAAGTGSNFTYLPAKISVACF